MATVARPQEFLAQFNAVLGRIKTPLNLTEAQNWIAAKSACDQSKNAPDKVAFLGMLEKGLGKRKVSLFNKLEVICRDEIIYLINGYSSVNSVFGVISQYRNTLKADDENHIGLAFFKLPKSEYVKRRNSYKKTIKKKTMLKRRYYDDVGMVETARELLKSDSYSCVAMGLCLLTGRRPSEVLLTANFTEVKGHKNVVVFSGQLKTKDSKQARDNYLIPVLAPAKDIINALAKLRSLRDFSTLEVATGKTRAQMVNSKTAKTQNDTVARYFGQFLPSFTNNLGKVEKAKPYNLRQVYLDIAYRWFISGELDLRAIPELTNEFKRKIKAQSVGFDDSLNKDDATMFSSLMLGHGEIDLETVHSYMQVTYGGKG